MYHDRTDVPAAEVAALRHPEPFAVEVRPDRERVFVIPRGELDLATVGRVWEHIDDLVAVGFKAILLDLRRLSFIDSTGIRLVVHEARREDATVELVDSDGPVRRAFEAVGLRDMLPFVAAP